MSDILLLKKNINIFFIIVEFLADYFSKSYCFIALCFRFVKFVRSVYCSIFLMLFSISLSIEARPINEVLQTISQDDLEDLNYLFRNIFLHQDGAYVIFGDKPVSSCAGFLIGSSRSTIQGRIGKFGNAWKTWEKHSDKFPMSKYAIVSEKYKFNNSEQIALHVFVINKEAFIQSIQAHQSLFEVILNLKIRPKHIYDEIASGRKSLWESIHHNKMLMGILLGYGIHNASLFNKRSRDFLYAFPAGDIHLKPVLVKLKSFCNEKHPLMILDPVQYVADLDHPETMALQKKYNLLRKKIAEIYGQGDKFLEITLSQLIS